MIFKILEIIFPVLIIALLGYFYAKKEKNRKGKYREKCGPTLECHRKGGYVSNGYAVLFDSKFALSWVSTKYFKKSLFANFKK